MAWTAWLMGKNETADAVECQVEFRNSDPSYVPFSRTVLLSPKLDGITDGPSATLKLRTKVSMILKDLNDVESLGNLVESNIGAQIPPVALTAALPDTGTEIHPPG